VEGIHHKLGHPILWTIAIVAVLASIGYILFGNREKEYITTPVIRGNVVQSVSASGPVEPAEEVDLAFEVSGKVSVVNVDVGDRVEAGQVLVQLDSSDEAAASSKAGAQLQSAQAQLLRYQAVVDEARATLDELLKGTRAEELSIQESKVDSAKQTLDNSYGSIKSLLQKHYAKSDDAVRKQTDEIFLNDNLSTPQLSFSVNNFQVESDAEYQRFASGLALNNWLSLLNSLGSSASQSNLDSALTESLGYLDTIRVLLDTVSRALDSSLGLSDTTVTGYKANVNTGRANIATAVNEIVAQQQTIASNKQSLITAQEELNLLIAGTSEDEVNAQRARVKQAEASLAAQLAQVSLARAEQQAVQVNLGKTRLLAPFRGVITEQKAKTGSIVSANGVLITLISDAEFEIELNVSEVDIAKFRVGDHAQVTFDAYNPDIKVPASVASIDPADRLVSGVPSYRVVLLLDNGHVELRAGMTANAVIESVQVENVLLVPQRAVYERLGNKFVKTLKQNGTQQVFEKMVETGATDGFGNIEIISGLNEGEQVIISEKLD